MLPTAASPEHAETKPQFSPKTHALDDSPVGRYGSAREKECLDLHPFKEEL
jgi:hypothetical protein